MLRLLLLVLLFTSTILFAQKPKKQSRPKVQVTGKVIDKVSKQGLEYSTLVFKPLKGKRITGGITDSKGYFNIEVPVGMYSISVEFLSFKTKILPDQKIAKNLDLGTIILEEDRESLGEIEIIAEKSTVEIRLDKKIYNVGKDMTIKGGTASDVLENVPSVTVDVEGTVSLRGNESVRILIDGKPSGLVGLSGTDVLRQLPAEAIQKVEVITSPSARYDAEGTAGIINIILRKRKILGFNASTTLSTGIPDNHGIAANINYRANKFNIFTNLGYSYRNAPGNAYFKNYNKISNLTLHEEIRDYQRKRNGFNSNVGIEYYLTDKASVTGSFLYRNSIGVTTIDNNSYKFDTAGILEAESFRQELEDEVDNIVEYALNFTQKFNSSDHILTIDAKFQDSFESENSFITDTAVIPLNSTVLSEKIESLAKEQDLLLKADYVLPIGENQQFEAGYQSQLKKLNTDYTLQIDTTGSGFELDDGQTNRMDFNENVHAVYTQYGNKFGKFSILAGLRAELTDIEFRVAGMDLDFDKNYVKLFPTLNVSYELKESESITLGYNRRIRRPRSWQVNPFPSRSSATNIFQGNPDLDPIFSDGIDLGYFKKWDKVTFNTSVYYRHSNNAFQFVREDSGEVTENGIPIIISSPINLNKRERVGMEFSLNYKAFKSLRFSNSFNFYSFKTQGTHNGIDYGTKNVSWSNRFNSRIKLFKEIDFQATIFYRGPRETAVSKRESILMANVAMSKDIFKDKGTIAFTVSDLFNSRKRKMETYFNDFTSYSEFQWRQRQFKLSFTYRFNQKKKYKRPGGERNGDGEEEYGG